MDPNFDLNTERVCVQTFANSTLSSDDASTSTSASDVSIESASLVSSKDGYIPSAMLFVDEEFFFKKASREHPMSSLGWQPVVKFCSSHYKFVKSRDGTPQIIQVGIGMDSLFGKGPAAERVAPLG